MLLRKNADGGDKGAAGIFDFGQHAFSGTEVVADDARVLFPPQFSRGANRPKGVDNFNGLAKYLDVVARRRCFSPICFPQTLCYDYSSECACSNYRLLLAAYFSFARPHASRNRFVQRK